MWLPKARALPVALVLLHSAALAGPTDDLNQIGQARLRVMFFHIYDSMLYSEDGRFEGVEPDLALRIDYRRRIKSTRIIDQTRAEWQKQNLCWADCENWLNQMQQFLPDVKRGDQLTLRVDETLASEFYFNDQLIGTIRDAQFTRHFLAIWLSENSSYPKLRNRLVGQG